LLLEGVKNGLHGELAKAKGRAFARPSRKLREQRLSFCQDAVPQTSTMRHTEQLRFTSLTRDQSTLMPFFRQSPELVTSQRGGGTE
jgi:hypothetical protein